jgi:hypothetical protein
VRRAEARSRSGHASLIGLCANSSNAYPVISSVSRPLRRSHCQRSTSNRSFASTASPGRQRLGNIALSIRATSATLPFGTWLNQALLGGRSTRSFALTSGLA